MPIPPSKIYMPNTRPQLRTRSSRLLMLCQIHLSTVDTDRILFSALVYDIVAYRPNVLFTTVDAN